MSNQPPPKRVPLGPPLRRTDEDLDRLSQVTADDVEAATAEASEEARAFLEAEPMEEDGDG